MDRHLCGLFMVFLPLCVGGCTSDTVPGADIHDRKYVAIDAAGNEIAGADAAATCALDRYTGLMWEIKSNDGGLHDVHHSYSWYNPEESNDKDGLDYRGVPDGGTCAQSACDTWAYLKAVNEAGLCGFRDWRLPLRDELASISDPRRKKSPPTINTAIFIDARPVAYWSSNDYHFQFDAAWVWDFRYGHDRVEWKKTPEPVRLVRGDAAQLARVKD